MPATVLGMGYAEVNTDKDLALTQLFSVRSRSSEYHIARLNLKTRVPSGG